MQTSSYIIDRAPLKYGGQQDDYQHRMQTIVSWGARKIKETPRDETALVALFSRLLEQFMRERQTIACEHRTIRAKEFGYRRDEELNTKDFYYTILDDVYKDYNTKILTVLAPHLREMSLESKHTSKKQRKFVENHLDRLSSFEIEIFEQEDLIKSKWNTALTPSEFPSGFPSHLMQGETGTLSVEESKIWKQALKKLKDENPEIYKRIKMITLLVKLQNEFPSPIQSSSSIGNEANRKSFFALTTVRLLIQGKSYAITQYLTWLYRDFVTHPVDRMLKHSQVMVIHQDNFLINVTLQEIASIFAKAILSNKEDQNELEQNTGLLRHYFANCMPCERGSASIGEMFEGSIYGSRDLEVQYNPKKQIDLEALTSPLLSCFMADYGNMRALTPISSPPQRREKEKSDECESKS